MEGVCPSPTTGAAPQIFGSAIQFFAAAQCLITDNWPVDAEVQGKLIFSICKFFFAITKFFVRSLAIASIFAKNISQTSELDQYLTHYL